MSSVAEVVRGTRTIIYLGMDVHKESITIAVLPNEAEERVRDVVRCCGTFQPLLCRRREAIGYRLSTIRARSMIVAVCRAPYEQPSRH